MIFEGPKPLTRFANPLPMLPSPKIPTVFPAIRRSLARIASTSAGRSDHAPSFRAAFCSGINRVIESNIAIAWSATSEVLIPGVLVAQMPSSVAASRSIESTPTPERPTIFKFGSASRTLRVVCGTVPTSNTSASLAAVITSFSVRAGTYSTSIPASRITFIVRSLGGRLYIVMTTLKVIPVLRNQLVR